MEQLGQDVSSNSNISINFRLGENITDISQKIKNEPEISQINSNTKEIIEQKMFAENGMPYILLETNLCARPIKLFIDTGATVSIIANDVVKNEVIKENYILNLFGIAGKEDSVNTQGMLHGIFSMDNTSLKTKLHLIDRKYVGPGDGYLGFDFLAPYKVNIDLNKMILTINLKKLIKLNQNENDKLIIVATNGHLNEEIEENFLNILAQHYVFEPKRQKCLKKNHKNEKSLKKSKGKDPIEDKVFNKLDQKECQNNKFFKINVCQINCSTSPKVDTIAQNRSNLDNNKSFSSNGILDSEMYQTSLACGKIPQQKIENCVVSTLEKKYYPKIKIKKPRFSEINKNSDLNTSYVHYFKDYG